MQTLLALLNFDYNNIPNNILFTSPKELRNKSIIRKFSITANEYNIKVNFTRSHQQLLDSKSSNNV